MPRGGAAGEPEKPSTLRQTAQGDLIPRGTQSPGKAFKRRAAVPSVPCWAVPDCTSSLWSLAYLWVSRVSSTGTVLLWMRGTSNSMARARQLVPPPAPCSQATPPIAAGPRLVSSPSAPWHLLKPRPLAGPASSPGPAGRAADILQ